MGLFSFLGQLCCLFPMDLGNTLIITMSLDIFWWILAFEFSHTITVRHLFAWTNIKYTVKLQVNINALICSMVYNYMFEFNFLHATFLETNTSVKFDLFVWYMLNNVFTDQNTYCPKMLWSRKCSCSFVDKSYFTIMLFYRGTVALIWIFLIMF